MIAGRNSRLVGGLIVLAVVTLGTTVPTVVAAGPTGVTVTPADTTAATGDRVTVDIVVDDTDGGVGAWEATVNLSDGSVADIVDVRLYGSPGLRTVDIAEDNDSVYFDGALADTNDTGRVAIATVTIAVAEPGRTVVDLNVDALGDERGESYRVTETGDATIATEDGSAGNNTATETQTSDETGVVGGADETEAPDTSMPDSTPTVGASTPTVEPGTSTDTQTESTENERSTTTTETAETVDPSTPTSVGTSAPGFTALASLFALLLGTILLRGRR